MLEMFFSVNYDVVSGLMLVICVDESTFMKWKSLRIGFLVPKFTYSSTSSVAVTDTATTMVQ